MKRAFTLIELLVVIAIIAILAAILFPVFAQAKAAAKKTSSTSNAKQNMLGVLMYSTDHDDYFPVGCPDDWEHYGINQGAPTSAVAGWTVTTKPYIKNVGILRDPSDPLKQGNMNSYLVNRLQPGGDAILISYASNGYMNSDAGGAWGMYGVMGMNQAWMTGPKVPSQTTLTNVAETVALCSSYSRTDVWGPDSMISGVSWWDGIGMPGLAPDGTRDGTEYNAGLWEGGTAVFGKDNRNGGVTGLYQDKGVFAYADGHVKVSDPRATNPDPANQPLKNQWNGLR